MKKITIEDFENSHFKVEIEHQAADEDDDTLACLTKGGCYFRLNFDPEGRYVEIYLNNENYIAGNVIYAENVENFHDLLDKLADRFEKISLYYKNKQMLAKIVAYEIRQAK